MRYKAYPKYKDSGVEWLGDTPEGWEVRRLKYFARIKNGQDQKQVIVDNGKYPIYGSGGEFGRANSYLYDKVSVLLGRKGTVDKPLFIAEPFWTVDTMYYTKINSITNPKFFYYSCLTIPFGYYQYGSALPSMTQEDLHNHHFIAPSLKEQTQIATYLNQKTKKIDTLIEKQQRLIELLKEKRQALISHVVTKGLDDSVAMKESGVEWLGDVPEGWEVRRLGQYFIERREKVSDKDFEPLSVTKNGIVPQLSNTAKTNDGDNRKKVCKGDYVINSRSDRKGSSGLSSLDGSVSLINIILEPRNIEGVFVHHLLRSYPFQEEFYRYGKGIVADLWSTNYSEMKNINIPIPTLKQQIEIANYLDKKTKKIDTLIEKSTQAIALLKERRVALVSAVVGGKVDVRGELC